MARLFHARTVKSESSGRNVIVDAGCGTGIYAMFAARSNPGSMVIAYDKSTDSIALADQCKKRHNINNVSFFVASHDDFTFPENTDLIYTADSLVGEEEMPENYKDPIDGAKDMITRRLNRFRNALMVGGKYLLIYGGSDYSDKIFKDFAAKSGFYFKKSVYGQYLDDGNVAGFPISIFETALIFERS